MKANEIMKIAGKFLEKHGPKILTGLGIAGFVTSTFLAVKATPKAVKALDEKKRELNTEKLPAKEVVKTTWKLYLPAVSTGLVSAGCVIGATAMSTHQTAVLATAYAVSDTALKEYRAKTKEVVGEEKEKLIRDEIAKERIRNTPYNSSEVIMTNKPDSLCLETFSNRYFMSNIEKLRQIENILNRRMLDDMYLSVNDWYDEIGLSHTKIGDELGWNIRDGLIDFSYSSQLAEDGTPCLVIDAHIVPSVDFMSKW